MKLALYNNTLKHKYNDIKYIILSIDNNCIDIVYIIISQKLPRLFL